MRMFTAGLVPVYSANVPRFSDTLLPHSLLSQPLMLILMSSTLTLLDHFHHHEDSHILLTCVDHSLGGRKPSLSLASWQKLWLKSSSVTGFLALVSRPLLSLTVVHNSSPSCGILWWHTLDPSELAQPNVSTANLRLLWKHNPNQTHGFSTICSPWNSNHSQGGHILNGCRDGVRHNSPSSWRIPHPLSNIFAAWPIWLCIQPQNSHTDYPTSSTLSYPAEQQHHWWFIYCYPCFHKSWCCR